MAKVRSILRKLTIVVFWLLSPSSHSLPIPDGAFMTESEVLDFLVDLGARVSTELGLGLDAATLRQIAGAVIAGADMGDPDATARHMYDLLMAAADGSGGAERMRRFAERNSPSQQVHPQTPAHPDEAGLACERG